MGIFGGGDGMNAQAQVDIDDLKARVARLEAAVAALQAGSVPYGAATATPAGAEVGPGWMSEVADLKAAGNLIQAIKVYREHTGLGLKESKDAVEAMP